MKMMKYIYVFTAMLLSCTSLCAQNSSKDSIVYSFYKHKIYDTVTFKDRPFTYINQPDTKGNMRVRDSVNQKPALIYYFTSFCHPCHVEMPVMNKLYEEFKDRIDFLAFTPIPAESISEFYPESKAPEFPIISMPKTFFKRGFPHTYILDRKNMVAFYKSGGSAEENILKIDYRILHEWCEKVINKQ